MREFKKQNALVITVTPVSLLQNTDLSQTRYSPKMASLFWKKPEKGSDHEGQSENDGIQYWKVYFEFAYYTLLCPFRFVWDSRTKTYHCYSNRFQRMLHYTVFTIIGSCYLLRLRSTWSKSSMHTNHISQSQQWQSTSEKDNPTAYFDMAVYFFDSCFMLLLFLYFGTAGSKVLDVFKELQAPPFHKMIHSNIHKQKTRLWATLILLLCMTTVVMNLLEIFQEQGWNFAAFSQMLVNDAKVIFVWHDAVERVPWLFIALSVVSRLYQKILNDLGDILFTMSVLLFRNMVDNFSFILKTCEDPELVLEHYRWLKEITSKINVAVGFMNFAVIVGNLPFFATTVLEVFGTETRNIFVRLRYIIACCYFFPSICMAASANRKVEEMKEWICKKANYSKVSETKLMVFLHDLNFHSVALTANGILTINWNTVGSIISVILTYALLKSQFNQDPNCASTVTSVTNAP